MNNLLNRTLTRSVLGTMLMGAAASHTMASDTDNLMPPPMNPSNVSPIATELTPMFITLGFDDNLDTEGLSWVMDLLDTHSNPEGLDSYAKQTLKASFFMHCGPAVENTAIKALWRQLAATGHEIANHSMTHPDDKVNYNPLQSWMTLEQWQEEVEGCNAFLKAPIEEGGIGVTSVAGFRAPYMTYNNNTLKALVDSGIRYDVSFPAGITSEQNGTNNYWPHSLENGNPSQRMATSGGWKPHVNHYPQLWEIPLHTLIVPPDSEMEKYGLSYSLRDKIASRISYFDPNSGKGDNFDWNLYFTPNWGAAGLSEDDVVAIYQYNLDLRLSGNRAPLTLGLHSGFYGLVNGDEHFGMPETTVTTRQNVLKRFISYALSKPEVRFVTHNQLLDWVEAPEPLILCPDLDWQPHQAYSEGDVVNYQEKMWIAKWWTQLEMPGNTEDSPWTVIDTCTPRS